MVIYIDKYMCFRSRVGMLKFAGVNVYGLLLPLWGILEWS